MNKILAVVAHPDDEILGLGGTLLKHVAQGDEVSLLILGDGETSRGEAADISKRAAQTKEVADKLGVKKLILKNLPDNKFDSLPLLEIVKEVEGAMAEIKPEMVYTNHAYDLNVDHRRTFEAVLTACRPQPGSTVKKILTFETPSSTEWQLKDPQQSFCPNEYVEIEQFIEQKLALLKVYQDELRDYPHPRSLEGVKILAQYRGLEVGYKFAEAFRVIRKLNN